MTESEREMLVNRGWECTGRDTWSHPVACKNLTHAGHHYSIAVDIEAFKDAAVAAAVAETLEWSEDDKPIPEDEAISAAHPIRSGAHEAYGEAMRMVGAKRSKGALVDLVCWLIQEKAAAVAAEREGCALLVLLADYKDEDECAELIRDRSAKGEQV